MDFSLRGLLAVKYNSVSQNMICEKTCVKSMILAWVLQKQAEVFQYGSLK